MLWGRAAELDRLHDLVDAARAGESGCLCIRGEPGIGKTSLLEDAAAYADDCRVLRAGGVEAESALAFSGLFGLVRPLTDRLDELPDPSASALRGALGLGPPVGAERFAVGAATLGLLSLAAESEPVVCLIDDLHWLDAGSRDALLFAARRLGPEGIAIVVGLRDPEGLAIDTSGIPDLRLGGLEPAAAQELLVARGIDLAEAVVNQLTDRCAGNPLALAEVAAALSDRQRRGLEPLGPILPVGPEVSRSYAARLARLDAEQRDALLALALQEDQDPVVLAGALGRLGVAPPALDAAEDAGLVRRAGGLAVVVHPLARAAVVAAAAPADLRRVHRALGDAHDDPERRAWHLALAADGPDEDAAAGLEQVGGLAIACGDPLTASKALALAATLSPGRDPRARRYLTAGQMAAVAGVPPFDLLDRAADAATDQGIVDDATVMRVAVLAWMGDDVGVRRVLETKLAALERRASEKAAIVHGLAGMTAGAAADEQGAVRHGHAAARLWGRRALTGDPRSLEMVVLTGAAVAAFAEGDVASARHRLEECVLLLESGAGSIDIATPVGGHLVSMGEPPLARRAFTAAAGRARVSGQVASLAWTRVLGAIVEWADGDLRACCALAEEAKALGALCSNPYAAAAGSAVNALVFATRDDGEGCRHEAEWGLPFVQMLSVPWIEGAFYGAEGIVALNDGDLSAAETALRRARAAPVLPMFRPVVSDQDLVEVLVRLGDLDEAVSISSGVPIHGAFAPLSLRSRALVTQDPAEAAGLFDEALRLHEQQHTSRLERGRTHLLYGERLRRARSRTEGRGHLEAALGILEGLGAEGFAKRARLELRASGIRARPHAPASREELTGQERQVAQEIALGRSNREVAAALFLSPKTVEMHLTRVYRKLGLRSRAELARLVAHGGLDGATGEPPAAGG